MKITEFRQKIKSAEKEHLLKLTEEIYKALSKSKREENIDPIIDDILSGNSKTRKEKKPKDIPFDTLKAEITEFLENANNDLYFSPNRVIPKKKRSNWRFEVKNFIKELDKITSSDPNAGQAAKLYKDIYNILSRSCHFYIFVSDNPFSAVGITQADFYAKLVLRYFSLGYTRERISEMLEIAVSDLIDMNTLNSKLINEFISFLKTNDMRTLAIEISKEKISAHEEKLPNKKDKKFIFYSGNYDIEEQINNLCEVILKLSILLCESAEGVEYYFKHNRACDSEIVLYRALNIIDSFNAADKLWLDVYDKAVKKGIKPRDSLVREYKNKKKQV
ncbi:MAG: hypothetical protein IJ583_14490 [Firmicutes bacterium]|nr:hypothetical protein [Bacillota bacterium]